MKTKQNENINIPVFMKIEKGAIGRIGSFLAENKLNKVVIYFGNGLIDMFGSLVMTSLKENGVEALEYMELDTVNIEDITALAFSLPSKTQAVIGLGGGKVIDAAKYSSFLLKLPFISIPTSSSSDGFSSSSASLLIGGKRKSVPAVMAYGIIADTDVIKSAPRRFLYSGIGDMAAKITSLYDWQYEEDMGYTKINDAAMMIAGKALSSFTALSFENIEADEFLKNLLDALALSGIANEIAGGSAPVSGSEHLISHALDKFSDAPQLHGVQVGIATYIMSMVQENNAELVRNIFEKSGFFEYAATLNLDANEYLRAIDEAPSIKPFRHTFLHEEIYREKAKEFLLKDEALKKIFSTP